MGGMKIKNIIASSLMVLALSGCGYDGHYRYPCQDPANWQNAECNPPICEATGTCTKDLVGENVDTTNGGTNE